MFGFGQLINILKKNPKKIVFTEGEDARILEASSRLLASNFLHPILIGNAEKIAIGGGVSAQPLLLELINKNVDEVFSKNQSPIYRPDIVPCKFRNDANLIGALYLHLQN